MHFIDEVKIKVASGKGGDGCVAFRREKYTEFGGPSGGNGGQGGNICFIADEGLNTLLKFRGQKVFNAKDGEDGMGSQCDGKYGKDIILKVPIGTIISDINSQEILGDLTDHNQQIIMAKGGRGGLGNMYFKTSTNQAPRYAQKGETGQELELQLELKLIADIAFIGLPNAGKSTLISSISAAKPKIADYPFTTLEPNLGVVKIGDEAIVIADIPGLIEHAAEGKGLGHKFLKHIERTSALVHLVDCSCCLEPYEAFEDYITIRNELSKYSSDLSSKKEIICLSKVDAMSQEEIDDFKAFFEEQLDNKKVLPLSGVSHLNLDKLKQIMLKAKQ